MKDEDLYQKELAWSLRHNVALFCLIGFSVFFLRSGLPLFGLLFMTTAKKDKKE